MYPRAVVVSHAWLCWNGGGVRSALRPCMQCLSDSDQHDYVCERRRKRGTGRSLGTHRCVLFGLKAERQRGKPTPLCQRTRTRVRPRTGSRYPSPIRRGCAVLRSPLCYSRSIPDQQPATCTVRRRRQPAIRSQMRGTYKRITSQNLPRPASCLPQSEASRGSSAVHLKDCRTGAALMPCVEIL